MCLVRLTCSIVVDLICLSVQKIFNDQIDHSRTIIDGVEYGDVSRDGDTTAAASKMSGELLAGIFVKTFGLKVDLEASGVTNGVSLTI